MNDPQDVLYQLIALYMEALNKKKADYKSSIFSEYILFSLHHIKAETSVDFFDIFGKN